MFDQDWKRLWNRSLRLFIWANSAACRRSPGEHGTGRICSASLSWHDCTTLRGNFPTITPRRYSTIVLQIDGMIAPSATFAPNTHTIMPTISYMVPYGIIIWCPYARLPALLLAIFPLVRRELCLISLVRRTVRGTVCMSQWIFGE